MGVVQVHDDYAIKKKKRAKSGLTMIHKRVYPLLNNLRFQLR